MFLIELYLTIFVFKKPFSSSFQLIISLRKLLSRRLNVDDRVTLRL